MTPGIVVSMAGGLGNQLFQYAAGRALSLRLGLPLTLDLSFFDRRRHRRYGLASLALAEHTVIAPPDGGLLQREMRQWTSSLKRCLGLSPRRYSEPHFHFDHRFHEIREPVTLVGGYQSEKYFSDAADSIRSELTPPPAEDELSVRLAREMVSQPSCAVHVRRGDYISSEKNRSLYASCGITYYSQAVESIPDDCTLYVFSDDMDWVRKHLHLRRPMVLVESGEPRDVLADLWLMSQAEHHIIANSTFSWWGAWLKTRAGLVCSPQHWFTASSGMDDRDLVPSGWIRL
jgi:hypothetical protein